MNSPDRIKGTPHTGLDGRCARMSRSDAVAQVGQHYLRASGVQKFDRAPVAVYRCGCSTGNLQLSSSSLLGSLKAAVLVGESPTSSSTTMRSVLTRDVLFAALLDLQRPSLSFFNDTVHHLQIAQDASRSNLLPLPRLRRGPSRLHARVAFRAVGVSRSLHWLPSSF